MGEMSLRDKLAALAHRQWSGWMDYLFKKCTFNDDGTATIPAWAVKRWKRQMQTPFEYLPLVEQESDYVEADKVIAVLDEVE